MKDPEVLQIMGVSRHFIKKSFQPVSSSEAQPSPISNLKLIYFHVIAVQLKKSVVELKFSSPFQFSYPYFITCCPIFFFNFILIYSHFIL